MNVGVLCTQGLPARHGGFEQTVSQLVLHAQASHADVHFFVACAWVAQKETYAQSNVSRLFFKRSAGLGVIAYGLRSFWKMYKQGIRTFLIMGYGLAPFFKLFEMLGCRLICNVDGFEWRRAKWGKAATRYFKLCEYMAVSSGAELIFDANGISRYYRMRHKRTGTVLFYGTEPSPIEELFDSITTAVADQYYVVVMRMEPENHILEIVRAYLASKSERKLVLVGPSTAYFERHVKPMLEADVSNRIHWLGSIYDRPRLLRLRSQAFATIHGHSVGGTNPSLVDACWLGRPVIAFGSIFNREVLGSAGTYFLNENSLTSILNEVDCNLPPPPLLDERYTWPYVCNGYMDLLMKIPNQHD